MKYENIGQPVKRDSIGQSVKSKNIGQSGKCKSIGQSLKCIFNKRRKLLYAPLNTHNLLDIKNYIPQN